MATIVDRRFVKDTNVPTNKQRFLQRYKDTIKSQVEKYVKHTKIKDIKRDDTKINISKNDMVEPSFSYDKKKGIIRRVSTGNKVYHKNDKVPRPSYSYSKGNKSGNNEGEISYDDYMFTLSKDEFLDLFFSDLELPNFIKQSFKKEFQLRLKRAGYSKYGTYSKLNLKKTFEQSLARRISARSSGRPVPFLDDIDLRYNLFTKQPIQVASAAMFCMMDVSGSMGEDHRFLAKNFYILLYLFLEKVYRNVEVHFIVYHMEGKEVSEDEFFKSKSDGGTHASSGLKVLSQIIKDKYSDGLTNLYLAHTSDGDNWSDDTVNFIKEFNLIEPLLQYIVYLDVKPDSSSLTDLGKTYRTIKNRLKSEKLKIARIKDKKGIYPALQDLFSKQEL